MSNFKLIDIHGAYIHTEFIGNGLIWRLIGSESIKSDIKVFKLNKAQHREHVLVTTQDTFKSEKGSIKTYMRFTIDVKFNEGKITIRQ